MDESKTKEKEKKHTHTNTTALRLFQFFMHKLKMCLWFLVRSGSKAAPNDLEIMRKLNKNTLIICFDETAYFIWQ